MGGSSAADKSQLSLLSTLFIARYSREPLRFSADVIASMLADVIMLDGVFEEDMQGMVLH